MATALMARVADINGLDEEGETPLHRAAYAGEAEVAELLLARGASVEVFNGHGLKPLDVADNLEMRSWLRRRSPEK